MKLLAIVFLSIISFPALAADKALILNDREQAAFLAVLDAATKAKGMKMVPFTTYFRNKLKQAGIVTNVQVHAEKPKGEPHEE